MVCLLMFWLVCGLAGANEKKASNSTDKAVTAAVNDIFAVYSKEEHGKVLKMADEAIKKHGPHKELLRLKFMALTALNRDKEALALIEDAIKTQGENEEFLSAKSNVLLKMKRQPDALKAAMRKDEIAKIKSPWDAMNIMHLHLAMKSTQDALDWLQEAVSRGFIHYRILDEPRYQDLRKEKKFYQIIESIKLSIGLGERSKNFQARTRDGQMFNLWRQKGKVVLVHFWATWCGPCHDDMPALMKTWRQFKDRGLEVISISLDSDQTRLNQYLKRFNLPWKMVFTGKGWQDETVKRYGISSVPSYWLIDKKSVLRAMDLKGRELNMAIAQLLAEK